MTAGELIELIKEDCKGDMSKKITMLVDEIEGKYTVILIELTER